MKQLVFGILLLFGFKSHAQSFFDISVVHKVEINFFDENWDHLLDSLASLGIGTGSGSESILAEVIINETAFDSCGVRYKGNSSMDTTSNKNPFNIDLNYTIGSQEYQGKKKIKLANCFSDPSMIREALSYEISNYYMNAPRASFVELYINGEYRGIYTNTESIDDEFLNEHYGDDNNPFFKCDPVTFDLGGDNSNLAYLPDSMDYEVQYDMKSDYGLSDLQELCYQLEFAPETIEDYLDVDRALWFLAVSSALVHNDGYTAFGHNYYVYKMENGQWSIVIWDVNMSFGGLLWNGTNLLPLGAAALQEQDPYLHEDNPDLRPLIGRLLANPRYRKMYTAHLKTITEENLSNGNYLERAEFMHDLISESVETEPYPHYSFEDFNTNLYENVGVWFDLRPGIEALIEPRVDYLEGLPEFEVTQPTIGGLFVSDVTPDPYTSVNFTATVSDANFVQMAYRYNQYDRFMTAPMFDDGLHGDGAAGDGVYGVDITILSTDLQYYFYAENPVAGKFSPVRAAHEYYTLTPQKGLVINEISANNASIAMDEAGQYEDWIELYNNSTENINLLGYYLSDELGDMTKWAFPEVSIAPNAYLIVWADNDAMVGTELHANFQLSNSGEVLTLSNPSEQIVDQIDFPEQFEDLTYGRFENGTGMFTYLYPTFNAENTEPVGVEEVAKDELTWKIYPNPASEVIQINYSNPQSTILRIFDVNGKLVLENKVESQTNFSISVGHLTNGIYFVTDTEGLFFKLMVN